MRQAFAQTYCVNLRDWVQLALFVGGLIIITPSLGRFLVHGLLAGALFEVQREKFYQAHTYKHTTMGFIKDIEDMPNQLEYSKTFFSRWYRPEYTTVIVAGDVKPAETIRLVEK